MDDPWKDFESVAEVMAVEVSAGVPALLAKCTSGNLFVWLGPKGHGMDSAAFVEMAGLLTEGLAHGFGLGRDGWEWFGAECGSPAARESEQALLLLTSPDGPVC